MSETPSAVQLFAFEHPSLTRTLRGKLTARRNELLGQITSAQNWPDFTSRCGRIAGLDEAIGICADIEQQSEN